MVNERARHTQLLIFRSDQVRVLVLTLVVATVLTMMEIRGAIAVEPAWSFSSSALEGAGFQNVVAVDPFGSGVVLAGGDVAGVHRSTDLGHSWSPVNAGLWRLPQLRVATIAFSPMVQGTVFAGVGSKGEGGGVLRSTDYGRTWTLLSTAPQFSGANNRGVKGVPSPHPRSTGKLLVPHPSSSKILFAATFDDGVMRSDDGGLTWKTLGLEGKYLRGLALDPDQPDIVYVATYGSGVYRVADALRSGTLAQMSNSPPVVEELVVVDGTIYAAGGKDGVFRSADQGKSWVRLGEDVLRTDGPVWMSIDGYRREGNTVLYVGANAPTPTTEGYQSIMRSADGGKTWANVTSSERIDVRVAGPTGHRWWLSGTEPGLMLGKGGFTPAQIVVDTSERRIFVAGRSGLWGTSDGADTWHPLVRGLGVTLNRALATDPNHDRMIYVASTDWVLLTSTDGLASVRSRRPPSGNVGLALAVDGTTEPSTVSVAVGDRDANALGEVYSNPDVTGAGVWIDEGLSEATGGKRPLGIAVGYEDGRRVLIAAVEGDGIWRKTGRTWHKINGEAMTSQRTTSASMIWPPGTSLIYLFDRETGVWRSANHGKAWTHVWKLRRQPDMTGFLAVDPVNPARLYVSVARKGVFVIEDARSGVVGNGLQPREIGTFLRPSAIQLDRLGRIYVTQLVARDVPPELHVSTNGGLTWIEVADDSYRSVAGFPLALTVGCDGRLYSSLNGNGVLVGIDLIGQSTPPWVRRSLTRLETPRSCQ